MMAPVLMELAPEWDIKRVLNALHGEKRQEKRLQLAQFIEGRYNKRFFEPISVLETGAVRGKSARPYGFAIMSLACQMVETLESYREGIPTTSKGDFDWMTTKDPNYKKSPKQVTCEKKDIPTTEEAFSNFFSYYGAKFPGLKGDQFFRNFRNSLLHQSQTRNGWTIKIHPRRDRLAKVNEVYVETEKILYRDSFVSQLRCCFASFIEDLRQNSDNEETWKNPERKIWWIAWLSAPEYLMAWVKSNPGCAK
jgi:hypothetical protein